MARDTNFYLYKNVNLTLGSGDTFYFATRSAQNNFFASKLFQTISTCSYQRENRSYIKVPVGISSLYTVDYLAFINPSYENKRYYCFVTEINYISDNCTEIGYVVDFIQTWLLDSVVLPCFIERQHSRTDNIGDNLLEDSLETGDYIIRSKRDGTDSNDLMIIIQATFDLKAWVESNYQTKSGATTTFIKNGIYSALSETCVYASKGTTYGDMTSAFAQILENIFIGSGGVTIDDIVTMYIYPWAGLYLDGIGSSVPGAASEDDDFNRIWNFSNSGVGGQYGRTVSLPGIPVNEFDQKVIGSYVPKNNKLFTFPYCLLHITNNNGSAIDLKFERFDDPVDIHVGRFLGTTTAEAKVRFIPSDYLGGGSTDIPFEFGLDSAPYPTIAQIGDSYNIWLAQNRNYLDNKYFDSMDLKIPFTDKKITLPNSTAFQESLLRTGNQAIGSLKQGQAGVGSMAVFGMNETMNTIVQVENFLAETRDRAIAPNTAQGLQSMGLAFQNGKKNFSFYVKTVDEKHAKMIDDYFTMFGYPVREIAQPAFHVRENFTYIKTVGAIVRGNLPEIAKQAIEAGLNSGLRFWANPANIGDFSVSNNTLP